MKITSKIVMGAATAALAIGMTAVVGGGSAFAAKPHKSSTGTGTVTCSGVKGTISFKPALTSAGGASSESAKVSVKLSGCSGGTPTPASATVTATISTSSNSCTALASPSPTQTESLVIKWSPKTILSSTASFGPDTAITSPNVGFKLSGGHVTGSYAGSSASATVLSSESTSALGAACAGKKGLSKLAISSGTTVIG